MEIILTIRRHRILNTKISARLRELYGERYSRALEAVTEGRVKAYRFMPSGKLVWIVESLERDYMVIPLIYCDCEDFYLNVVLRRLIDVCYHLLAQALAEAIGKYEIVELPDELYLRFIEEWLP